MSHISNKDAYKSLEERINRFPQGAPPSKTLYKILSMLFSEKEAELVAMLPIKPFKVKTASKIWKMDEVKTENILQTLASKAILLDIDFDGKKEYCLAPPMIGFFEFSLMRTRGDIDQKALSELYFQYLNVEEDFIKDLFLGTETRFGKVFVQEGVLSRKNELEIMDYDRASNVIKHARFITVSMCFCRHKTQHLGENCNAPMETCITLGDSAYTLNKHGYGRAIDASEGIDILNMAQDYNLVQCGENVRNGSVFMCNCCGCCCEGMMAVKKFGSLNPIQTTAFIPKVIEESCVGCEKCEKACPIDAIKVDPTTKKAIIDESICLGCGICVRNCFKKSIYLKHRDKQIITPSSTTHRIVLQAIEKGKLPELLFDNKALLSHRAMASVLSAILKLPPIKRVMASKQMKSVYLDKLLSKK